jgi:predicted  nucleic acid-binding Zn-ribbon protein
VDTLAKKVENTEERVNFVESALGHFIVSTTSALNRLENEMKEFKDEMKEFKNEMKMFKDEMLEYKNWSKSMIENMNAQWGNLARKMGTLVEDIFYPSAEIVIKKFLMYCPIPYP